MPRARRLKKYSVHVTKDKSGTDVAQVPASGVTVTPYRRGVWANQTVTLTVSAANLTVREIGMIQAGDTLQLASDLIAGNATPVITVDASDPYGTGGPSSGGEWDKLKVAVTTGTTMDVAPGDRLVPTNNTPSAFSESSGLAALGSFTTDATGYAAGYLEAEGNAIDALISGGGVDSVMYYDEWLGGAEEHIVYADDYATLQDAIDACPARGTVQMSSKQYEPAATLTIDKGLILRGEGEGANLLAAETHHGTTIKQVDANTHVISCTTDGVSGIHLQNFRIQGVDVSGTGNGVNFVASSAHINYCTFRNMGVTAVGNHGFYLHINNFPLFDNVTSVANYGDGFRLTGTSPDLTTQVRMFHTYAQNNEDYGVYLNNVIGVQIDGIGIEDNHQDQTAKTDDGYPQLYMQTVHEVSIQRTDFEDWQQATTKTAIEMNNCRGVVITGNGFVNPTSETDTIGIKFGENNDGIFIGPNRFFEVNGTCIWMKDATTDSVDVGLNIVIMDQGYAGSIGTKLDLPPVADRENKNIVVFSEEFGMMLPVIPTASLPAAGATNEGCIVYDSTAQVLLCSDGTNWVQVGTGL